MSRDCSKTLVVYNTLDIVMFCVLQINNTKNQKTKKPKQTSPKVQIKMGETPKTQIHNTEN